MGKCNVILCYDRDTLEPVVIPEEDRFLNMLVLGPTGTGKSSQVLLPLIYQDIMNPDCGVTVIDPKEDLAEDVYELSKDLDRKVIYVDPTDPNCPKLNPFIGSEDVVTKTMLKIFSPTFMVRSNEEKKSLDNCRNLIIRSVKILKTFPDLCDNNLNINTFSNFISNKYNSSREKLNKLIETLRMKKNDKSSLNLCEWFLYQYFEPTKNIYDSCAPVRIKIDEMASNKYLSRVMSTDSMVGIEKIDFNKHLQNKDIVIMNTKNTILGPLGKTFGEFIMLNYLSAVFGRKHYAKENNAKDIPPNFLYIDEFATFSPVLTEMFTQGRSFRIGTHIAVQNRQLLKMCGEENTEPQSMLIESNARNLVLFPGLNGSDAKYYSDQFYNFKPYEIAYRPFGEIVYRIVQNRSITKPAVGLTFFIDEEPSKKAIEKEAQYKF